MLTDDGRCSCKIKSRIAMAKAAFNNKKNLFTSKLDLNLRKKLVKCSKEVTRRRGRRRKKLLVDLGDRRGYSHLKEEALDRIKWRNRFGGGCGPVV
jgi:hypothetical protein